MKSEGRRKLILSSVIIGIVVAVGGLSLFFSSSTHPESTTTKQTCFLGKYEVNGNGSVVLSPYEFSHSLMNAAYIDFGNGTVTSNSLIALTKNQFKLPHLYYTQYLYLNLSTTSLYRNERIDTPIDVYSQAGYVGTARSPVSYPTRFDSPYPAMTEIMLGNPNAILNNVTYSYLLTGVFSYSSTSSWCFPSQSGFFYGGG